MICEQKTNIDIGEELGKSKRTIENTRQRIIKKAKVVNSAGLVMFAIINKLAPLDPAMKTKIAVRSIAEYMPREKKPKKEKTVKKKN